MNLKLDDWQKEFIETKGDRVLCCGRQVGKSEICGIDAGEYAMKNKNKTILMIAPTERQAFSLFNKTLDYLMRNYRSFIKKGKDRPTKTKIFLNNGAKIYCLPTGLSGLGIRFLTVHKLYADEASRIPEEVWTAVTPMMLTTGGEMTLLSTPAGPDGYFADIVENRNNAFDSFTRFSISSKEVVETREICETWSLFQKEKAIEYLEREKKRMTHLQYAQEYEGEIIEDLKQFFPEGLIRSCMTTVGVSQSPLSPADYFLGVDVARMGEDETVLFSLQRSNKKKLTQVDMQITTKTLLTDTVRLIKSKDLQYNYKKIYIDDGGMGVGVFDPLLEDSQTKRKVVPINNASRSIDMDNRKKKILKEDLYTNLLRLMEQKKITLDEDDRILHSLKGIQFEYTKDKNLRIFGKDSHIAEALIRAAWCMKDKALNIYIY